MNAIARLMNLKRGELSLAALAALFYFCVLCGYFFLRPVREAMGVSRGMDELRWLFVVTSISSLAIVLAFGGVVSKLDRRKFIPIGYLFIIGCLALFAGLLIADVGSGGGLIGSEAETSIARGVGYTYYVWLSVINLFANALFWAFMVDVFNVDQGKRMFAFIGIGGTLGAIVGGWATTVIADATNSAYLPPGLMVIGAVLFGAAIVTMLMLDRMAVRSRHSRLGSVPTGAAAGAAADRLRIGPKDEAGRERIGGTFWDGATAVAKSPYLLGIGAYIVMLAIANTMIYFTQANIIVEATDTFSQRVESFAQFDMLAQIATLFTQMFVTTHVIRRLGVGMTLAILPAVTVAGFAILAIWPLYGVIMLFQAVHRATRYAISRPARETLFSVVPPSEKYKAKPVVDVFLYRGGDVAGVGIDAGFSALGLTLSWVAAATVPLAAGWGVLSIGLGRAQARRDAAAEEPEPAEEPVAT